MNVVNFMRNSCSTKFCDVQDTFYISEKYMSGTTLSIGSFFHGVPIQDCTGSYSWLRRPFVDAGVQDIRHTQTFVYRILIKKRRAMGLDS